MPWCWGKVCLWSCAMCIEITSILPSFCSLLSPQASHPLVSALYHPILYTNTIQLSLTALLSSFIKGTGFWGFSWFYIYPHRDIAVVFIGTWTQIVFHLLPFGWDWILVTGSLVQCTHRVSIGNAGRAEMSQWSLLCGQEWCHLPWSLHLPVLQTELQMVNEFAKCFILFPIELDRSLPQ